VMYKVRMYNGWQGSYCQKKVRQLIGRAVVQAVSRRLPTAAAQVRSQVRSCGICGGQSVTGQVSSEYFGFPCQFSFYQMFHNHLSSGAGTIGELMADVPSGLILTPPQKTKATSPHLHMCIAVIRNNFHNGHMSSMEPEEWCVLHGY
jgi:hypothetical protein